MAQLATYALLATASNSAALTVQVGVAIAVAAAAILNTTPITDPRYLIALQLVSPAADVIHRCANRILIAGAMPANPGDSDVQTAVNLLIPAAGAFAL